MVQIWHSLSSADLLPHKSTISHDNRHDSSLLVTLDGSPSYEVCYYVVTAHLIPSNPNPTTWIGRKSRTKRFGNASQTHTICLFNSNKSSDLSETCYNRLRSMPNYSKAVCLRSGHSKFILPFCLRMPAPSPPFV